MAGWGGGELGDEGGFGRVGSGSDEAKFKPPGTVNSDTQYSMPFLLLVTGGSCSSEPICISS